MNHQRSTLIRALLALVIAGSGTHALAQTANAWPTKPVKIIMPSLPAGSPDRVTRMVAEKLAIRWGQPVTVEYKPGATTVIGTDFVARSPADGYTLLSTFTSLVQAPALLPKVPWDPERDFTPIVQFIRSEVVLLVRSDSPYKSITEFIQGAKTAKASGAPLNYASFGNASSFHIYGETLKRGAGIDLTHIPYKGEAASMVDLMGGQVVSSFNSIGTAMPHIKSGRVRALALVGAVRSKVLPEVPTFGEAGVAKMDTSGWFGMLAPAGTPRSIVDKIAADTAQILALPEIAEALRGQGLEPTGLGPDAFGRFLREDLMRWKTLIQEVGVKADS